MHCVFCKGNLKESFTTHFVDLKNAYVIIKNVPCLECENCGEVFYSDVVTERLDEIVKSVRKLMTEVAIIEYTDKVA